MTEILQAGPIMGQADLLPESYLRDYGYHPDWGIDWEEVRQRELAEDEDYDPDYEWNQFGSYSNPYGL